MRSFVTAVAIGLVLAGVGFLAFILLNYWASGHFLGSGGDQFAGFATFFPTLTPTVTPTP